MLVCAICETAFYVQEKDKLKLNEKTVSLDDGLGTGCDHKADEVVLTINLTEVATCRTNR